MSFSFSMTIYVRLSKIGRKAMNSVRNPKWCIIIRRWITHLMEILTCSLHFNHLFINEWVNVLQSLNHKYKVYFLQVIYRLRRYPQVERFIQSDRRCISGQRRIIKWLDQTLKSLVKTVVRITDRSVESIIDDTITISKGYFYAEYFRLTLKLVIKENVL